MKKALFSLCLALFTASPAFAQDCAAPEPSPQEQKNYLKKLVDIGQLEVFASAAASCRPEGYFCRSSLDCCGFCHDGVCGSGGGGGCRPEGLACRNSLECCNFCRDGVCN